MSLKDLFGKTSENIVSKQQLQQLYSEAESKGLLEEVVKDKNRFLPSVDFSNPLNFAKYGSAEKYYTDAIKNIYQKYPYDGSKKEKLEWRNNSTQLDLYIFDNIYPKTTGYVNLGTGTVGYLFVGGENYRSSSNSQYIDFFGGPNAGPNNTFEDGNIYDSSKNRTSNLAFSPNGNTVEFWFKDNVISGSTEFDYTFCLFDLWNGNTTSTGSQRLTIEKRYYNTNNHFAISYRNGQSGLMYTDSLILEDYTLNDINNWHHYAFALKNNIDDSSKLDIQFYVDGKLIINKTINYSGITTDFNNDNLKARIGAYLADPNDEFSNTAGWDGLGTSFGSFDEFRFWKSARTSQQIYRNWNLHIGGGTNTDDANTDLGVYYKFNEGIINSSTINSLDAIVLDYSGRITNGSIKNYTVSCRSTGSAIDSYFSDIIENKDPIIYSTNPYVSSVLEEYTLSGSLHDETNSSNIYKSLPSWIIEEAEKKGYEDLSNLTQIISSYFDTLHVQIENLPRIKDTEYTKEGDKPRPFINKILSSYGFQNVDLFNDATFLEEILSRTEEGELDQSLSNIKNTIYENIYNNLIYIYKTKGTEESLRNLIRCFGVDDELIKINLYADNITYDITDKYDYVSTPKIFIDFNNPNRNTATVFQKSKSGDLDTKGYIPFSTSYVFYKIPLTLQTEIIFPKKITSDFKNYYYPNFTDVSLFGVHTAKTDEADLTWDNENFNLQVYAIKNKIDSKDVYFKLTGSLGGYGVELTSSLYLDVYDNQKWNFAVRLSPDKIENINVINTSDIENYNLEFIAYNSILDTKLNEGFNLSTSIPKANAQLALQTNKRIYIGAHRNNFTGSLLQNSDVKISSVRFWFDYLTNEEILNHSYDSSNYGRKNAFWNPKYISASAYQQNADKLASKTTITKEDTLALHWNFDQVTSSDSSGQFIVDDFSNGYTTSNLTDFGYDWFYKLVDNQYSGLGYNFDSNDEQVVNKEYIYSAKLQNYEILQGSDLISTANNDDVTRTKTSKPISYYISIEKSMAQAINSEIVNWLSTIKDFNNLIGEPIDRYRKEYKNLKTLRQLFFNKVNNTPDFEKFFNFYKWLDSSISVMIQQLLPASANSSDKIRNIIESTLLERNKYENKLPTIEFKGEIINLVATTGYTLNPRAKTYNFLDQKAPASPAGDIWLLQRAERTGQYASTPLEPQNDIDREIIRQVINYSNLDNPPQFYDVNTNSYYEGKKDLVRIFSKAYKLSTDKQLVIESSINPVEAIKNKNNTSFIFASSSATASGQIVEPKRKTNQYVRSYEFLQMTGRSNNNLSFINLSGNVSGTYVDSGLRFTNRTLPSRSVNDSIFVERFSAPGGPEVNSRGALDMAAEEYSAYSGVNYRNFRVRKNLRSWLAESSSYNSDYPSIHKIPKNPAYYLTSSSTASLSAKYDNAYISHQIPRSDSQYTWITSSLKRKPLQSGFVSKYDNLLYDYTFASSSNYSIGGNIEIPFINYRFIGDRVSDFILTDKIIDITNNTIYTGSAVGTQAAVRQTYLYFYLTSLNGHYNYPSWKQIRNADNPINIISRKNNYIFVQDKPTIKTRINSDGIQESYVSSREATFKTYKEPPVTFYKPMKHSMAVTGSNLPVEIISSYDNNKKKFANDDLNQALGVKDRNEPQTHDILLKLDNGEYLPRSEIINTSYSQYLYPKKENVGLKEIRTKPNYAEVSGTGSNGYDRNIATIRTFWRDSISNRLRSNAYTGSIDGTGSYNSLSFPQLSASSILTQQSNVLKYAFRMRSNDPNSTNISGITSSYDTKQQFSSFNVSDNIITSSIVYTAYPSLTDVKYYISGTVKGELAGFTDIENFYFFDKNYTTAMYSWEQISSQNGVLTAYIEYFSPYNNYYLTPRPFINNSIHYPYTLITNPAPFTQSIFIENNTMNYKTDVISGKKPFFDSYDEWSKDIKSFNRNYSILPEFNISSYMDTYIKDSNAEFGSTYLTGGYLSINGTSSNQDFKNLSASYIDTNIINNFLFEDINKGSKVLNIKLNAIKKLLPYNGFYPSNRTVQLVDLFQKSFFGLSSSDIVSKYPTMNALNSDSWPVYPSGLTRFGAPLTQQVQTILQPLFAPGILFNTIKSCLAVDWPIFFTSSNGTTAPYYTRIGNNDPYFYGTASFNSPTKTNLSSSIFMVNRTPDLRMPFESLLNPKIGFGNQQLTDKILYYVDPTRYNIDSFSGSDRAPNNLFAGRDSIKYPSYRLEKNSFTGIGGLDFKDSRYYLAMNNFLAEIPNFFLKDGKLTTFTSDKQSRFTAMKSGHAYSMILRLSKNNNFKTILDGGSYINASLFNNYSYINGDFDDKAIIPAGSTFGPPFRYFDYSSGSSEALIGHRFYNDPAYAPYTPPYFYGDKEVIITFYPTDPVGTERVYTLSEILNNLVIQEKCINLETIFSSSCEKIKALNPSNTEAVYKNSPAYLASMSVSSSINYQQIVRSNKVIYDINGSPKDISDDTTDNEDFWAIQTRFETPALNFNNSNNIKYADVVDKGYIKSATYNHQAYAINSIGMWSGYGTPVGEGEGISLTILNPQETYLTHSLANAVGFKAETKSIGTISSRKDISEAIVLIPYTKDYPNHDGKLPYAETLQEILGEEGITSTSQRGNGPYYFKINKNLINNILQLSFNDENTSLNIIKKAIINKSTDANVANNSIYKTIKLMTEYNLPPHLDWVANKNTIDPFVMYILEVKHTLDQQDLTDIWQGVMPKIATTAELETINFSHNLNQNELFHGKNFPPDMRWKIFKIKKKANINYFSLTADLADDRFFFDYGNITKPINYSYNWPYDFFSLVEMANIEAELKAGYDVEVKYPETNMSSSNLKPNISLSDRAKITKEVLKDFKNNKKLMDIIKNSPAAFKKKFRK